MDSATTAVICMLIALAFAAESSLAAGSAEVRTGRQPSGADGAGGAKLRIYVGTYTSAANGSKGIYMLDFDPQTGRLGEAAVAGEAKNPSFLAVDRAGRFLYAAGELNTFEGQRSGAVSAFAIDPDSGRLTLLNQRPSGGTGPCYVSLDRRDQQVLVANYGSGSVAVLPVKSDGRLGEPSAIVQHEGSGPNARRQTGPHAHAFRTDPSGRFALAPDLGIDKVMIYRLGEDGTLTRNDPPAVVLEPGAGPRHLEFHPNGRYFYVINELSCTITALAWDARSGRTRPLQTVPTIPRELTEADTCADIHVHPSGRFLYGSNRGHDSIAIFAIDAENGTLTARGHVSTQGQTPRNFNLDPSGRWLIAANQNSDSLVVFRVDPESGALEPTGQTAKVPAPVCVQFVNQ